MITTLLDRWQFGVTTVYHFLFVPLTIGLALLVAIMQTIAYLRHDEDWDRASRFFGQIFLIGFIMGVVTGIVEEFQFGMNWSNYSVFVGNIFGAPLAIEGLLAFFMESTFIGLWIFGRDKLPARLHLATIWIVSFGTILSAFFILVANAWMQHPVGYTIVDHKALLTNFWVVLANSTVWAEFIHTVLAAFVTGGMFLLGVAAWKMLQGHDSAAFQKVARLAAVFTLVCVIGTVISGDVQARLMDQQQPMKMAAAEAQYTTQAGASFSVLTMWNLSGQPIFQLRIPHLLSLISDFSWDATVPGIHQLQAAESRRYGAGNYTPIVWVTYWSFRLMVGLGFLMLAVAGWAVWLARRRRLQRSRWFLRVAVLSIAAPFLANTFGWLFTEVGRQPWVVEDLMKTAQAISPNVGLASVALTLGGFTALYTVLGVIDAMLVLRFARRPLVDADESAGSGHEPSLVY